MKDLLTNIKKAIEIINRTKNLTIQLTDPDAFINDTIPVGVSRKDWEESIKKAVRDLLFTADDLSYNFDCGFNFTDLLISENDTQAYTEAMKRIIKVIYDQYKYFRDLNDAIINAGAQNITGLKNPWNNISSCGNSLSASQSAFSNLSVDGNIEVQGEINADDIKVNGGQLSVSSELDELKKRNDALEAELGILKALLISKGVM